MALARKTVARPRRFGCPNCGGPVEVRYPGRALAVTCPSCDSVLDTQTPEVALLQAVADAKKVEPRIPLGTRVTLRGYTGEFVGFQKRKGVADGEHFSWTEYLLYNPYEGYRFLAETPVGWTMVGQTMLVPRPPAAYRGFVKAGDMRFASSERYRATTVFVMGEFYWKVKVGDEVRCYDFGKGRKILVAEQVGEEFTWAIGEKLPARMVWSALGLSGNPPRYEREAGTFVSPSLTGSASASGNAIATVIVLLFVSFMVLIVCTGMLNSVGSGGGYRSSGGYYSSGGGSWGGGGWGGGK